MKSFAMVIFLILIGCDTARVKVASEIHCLTLNKINENNTAPTCHYDTTSNAFFRDFSTTTLKNYLYDTLSIGLYKTNCDSLFVMRPSLTTKYLMENDTFKIVYSETIFLGSPDKILTLQKGDSIKCFVDAPSAMEGNFRYEYIFSIKIDSASVEKIVFLCANNMRDDDNFIKK
jgi:hypothetical protein